MHCRFNAAVKMLKVNDEDDLWVKLGQCNLKDSKARQVGKASLMSILKKSQILISKVMHSTTLFYVYKLRVIK